MTGANGSAEPVDGKTIVWQPEHLSPTSAEVLDEVRTLMVQAWDRGEHPDYLVLPPKVRERIATSKRREVRHGNPVVLLGLIVL